jgi:hypothetical protein
MYVETVHILFDLMKKNITIILHVVRSVEYPNSNNTKAIQEIGKLRDGNSIDYIFSHRGRRTIAAIAGFNIGNWIAVTFSTYL